MNVGEIVTLNNDIILTNGDVIERGTEGVITNIHYGEIVLVSLRLDEYDVPIMTDCECVR